MAVCDRFPMLLTHVVDENILVAQVLDGGLEVHLTTCLSHQATDELEKLNDMLANDMNLSQFFSNE
ncbi:hypothetical protein Q6247_26035, partial [Klebsiella pneumoniae]